MSFKFHKLFKKLKNFNNNKDNEKKLIEQEIKDNLTYLIPFEILNLNGEDINKIENRVDKLKLLNTGENAIILKWKNSEENFWNGEEYKRKIQIGKYYKCKIINENEGYEFKANFVNENYNEVAKSSTIKVLTLGDIKEDNKFYFWYLTQTKKFYYIVENGKQNFYDINNNVYASEITLKEVDNTFLKAGKSLDNYFLFSEAGGAYALPLIKNNDIELNKKYLQEQGCTHLHFEANNLILLNTLIAIGKLPQTYNENEFSKIGETKLLLPYKITPEEHNFFEGEVDNDFYYVDNLEMSLESEFDNWKEFLKGTMFIPDEKKDFEGFLNGSLKNDNSYLLWDEQAKYKIENNFNVVNDFFINKTFNYSLQGEAAQVLAHNFFLYNDINNVKFSKNAKVKIGVADIPYIGKVLGPFLMGIPFSKKHNLTNELGNEIGAFVNKNFITYANMIFKGGENKVKIPLNFLKNSEQEKEQRALNKIHCNFNVIFSDKFQKGDKVYDTLDLKNKKVYWDHTCKVIAPENKDGWVINAIIAKTIGDSILKLGLKNKNDLIVWEGNFKNNNLYTNNLKNWLNIFNFTQLKTYGENKNYENILLVNKNPLTLKNEKLFFFGDVYELRNINGEWEVPMNFEDPEHIDYYLINDRRLNNEYLYYENSFKLEYDFETIKNNFHKIIIDFEETKQEIDLSNINVNEDILIKENDYMSDPTFEHKNKDYWRFVGYTANSPDILPYAKVRFNKAIVKLTIRFENNYLKIQLKKHYGFNREILNFANDYEWHSFYRERKENNEHKVWIISTWSSDFEGIIEFFNIKKITIL